MCPLAPGKGEALGFNTTVLQVGTLRTNATWVPLGFLKAQAVVSQLSLDGAEHGLGGAW